MGVRKKTTTRRLLIVACSASKNPARKQLPALERYTGGTFKVIKRLMRLEQYPHDVDLLIISANYGLIRDDQPIPNYNLRMTPQGAREQAERNRVALRTIVEATEYREVFISAGKVYLTAIEPFADWRGTGSIAVNSGKIGVQLKTLKSWLLRDTPCQAS